MNEKTIITYKNAIGSLTFRYESNLWLVNIDGVSSVEIDVAESRSAAQIGSSITAQSVRPRSLTLDGAIFEPIRETRERVLAVIAPQVPATLTVEQNGELWYLDVVPERTPEFTPGNGVQYFQLRLYAHYPYWRTTDVYVAQVAGLVPMFRFPFYTGGRWWVSRYSDSYFTDIENAGNVPMDVKITFTARAALDSPELYHVGTRQRVRLNKAMVAGEQISVSTVYGQKGVVCVSVNGTRTNGFRYLSLDSDLNMTLIPGSNLLRVDAEQNRAGLSVRVEAPKGVKSGV